MRAKGSGESPLLLLDVIDVLNALQVPYAIVGAFAASFYGVVRGSVDADAVISLSSASVSLDALIDALHEAGLKTTRSKAELRDPIGTVIHIRDRFDNRVDLLMRIRGMTEAAFTRAVETEFMQRPVRIIGVEDFIAMKLFAGSSRDVDDAAGALNFSSNRVRRPLLKELAQQYGKETVQKLESLLREAR